MIGKENSGLAVDESKLYSGVGKEALLNELICSFHQIWCLFLGQVFFPFKQVSKSSKF